MQADLPGIRASPRMLAMVVEISAVSLQAFYMNVQYWDWREKVPQNFANGGYHCHREKQYFFYVDRGYYCDKN